MPPSDVTVLIDSLKTPGVIVGVFTVLLMLDKLAFWLVKWKKVLFGSEDSERSVLKELATAVDKLAENGSKQERLLERMIDRLDQIERRIERLET